MLPEKRFSQCLTKEMALTPRDLGNPETASFCLLQWLRVSREESARAHVLRTEPGVHTETGVGSQLHHWRDFPLVCDGNVSYITSWACAPGFFSKVRPPSFDSVGNTLVFKYWSPHTYQLRLCIKTYCSSGNKYNSPFRGKEKTTT